MRWVWRAESGAGKVEYAAVVLVVAGIVTTVMAFGLPGDVRGLYERALCLLPGDEECEEIAAGEDSASGGLDEESGGDSGDSSGGGSEGDDEGGEPGNSSNEESGDVEGEESTFDWDELQEDYAGYEAAQQELWEAESELEDAQSEFDGLEDDLLQLLKELIGLEDAEKCVTEGDIVACIWTLVGFAPWGKAAKVAKKIPAIARLARRWRGVRNTRNAARADVGSARTKVDDAAASCRVSNSFVAGSRVLLSGGSFAPIEQLQIGDQVLAGAPATGETSPRRVENTLSGSTRRDMVEIEISHAAPFASDTLHATADHPFWVDSRDEWVQAEELRVGDQLVTESGRFASVRLVHAYEDEKRVFNLDVAGVPTYYVSGGGPGVLVHNQNSPCPTKTDRIKEHLTEKDLDAARRELDGEVVARKPDGTPWDHVQEVREAQRGLKNRIQEIKRRLDDSRITAEEKAELEDELSEASLLLDRSEKYVPSP